MADLLGLILDEGKGKVNKYDESTKAECAKDLEKFCKTYFPDVFCSEFCEFHKDVFKTLETYILSENPNKSYVCRAAPRGHGKSQIISFALPLWCVAYGYRHNIVIVSDTGEQAEQFILDIKNNLEDNELFIRDFGKLATQQVIWRQREIVTDNNIHIVGKSAGQSLRGIKYNSLRPDLIIIDDLENDENVETEMQRVKLYNWFMKVLLKCGNTAPLFVYIGTVLNYASLLYKILNEPKFSMWNRKAYRAVYAFADNQKLWDKWESIMSDAKLGNQAKDKAYEFYTEHKAAMLKGVKCLWPQKEKEYYYNLMIEKYADEEAFNSELQNDPLTDDSRVFKVEWLESDMYTELPEITEVYYAVDMSMGKSKHSDTSAIIGVGKGVDNYFYVLQADVKRKRTVDETIDDLTRHIMRYYSKLKAFAVETDLFLEFVSDTMKDRVMSKGLYVPWVEIKQAHTGSKDMRIKGTLVSPIQHGYLKFHESQRALLKQLRNYPKDNDDAVDALQMAMSCVRSAQENQFCFTSLNLNNTKATGGGLSIAKLIHS